MTSEYISFESILSGKSLKDLIQFKDGRIDTSRFEALMRGVIEESSKRLDAPAHKLVRIVRNGRVQWTTVEEAKNLAAYHREKALTDNSEEIANQIEKSINGDVSILEDELLILLCMAESNSNGDEEILARLERRRQDSFDLIHEIRESENSLNKLKRDTGVVDVFEEKLGQMMHARNHGHEKKAQELAFELKNIKSKYLLYTRGLGPQVQKIRYLRGELVRIRERILRIMMNGVQAEERSLSISLDSLSKDMEKLEKALEDKAGPNTDSSEGEIDNLKQRMQQVQSSISSKVERIEAIQQEKTMLRSEIQATKAAADQLGASARDEELSGKLKEHQDNQPKIKESPGLESLVSKNTSRMHTSREA